MFVNNGHIHVYSPGAGTDNPLGLFFFHYLNLNLNSLLVKRQVDNPSPGAVTGGN